MTLFPYTTLFRSTRGVLSVAILREICTRVGKQPFEMFDIICGTSTGGIIAVLMGSKKMSVTETEHLYDEFIDKVFGKKSNVKLVTEQASYDELEFEAILSRQLGDEQFIDTVRNDCAKVFCVSTRVNTIPTTHIWRNYNYPPGSTGSRYGGSYRVNTMTAVRATTAAPTFFVPVQHEVSSSSSS
jgi:calcium-independent phospholipase A2-gamma